MATPLPVDSQSETDSFERPPSESDVDSLADVFADIDAWAGDPNRAAAGMANNPSIDKTYVGFEVSQAFKSIMFDGDDDVLPNRLDCLIAWGSISTKASHLYHRCKFLVGYLEAGKGSNKIRDFLQEVREDNEVSPHWQTSSKGSEFNLAWHTLWICLNFHLEIPIKASTFQGQIHELFHLPTQNTKLTSKFEINLKDLESVDLNVKPSSDINEHLLLEGNTLIVLKVDFEEINMLRTYKNNKAAKQLGLANLGEETLSSLYALYVKDEFWDNAKAAGLLSSKSEVDLILCETLLRTARSDTRPQVLSDRAHTLQKLVDYRRSWWPSLVRDVKKQIKAQPVLFYGAILAVFFGVCTVIQTIASVWSLVLALQATK